MTLQEAIKARHAVRSFTDRKIEPGKVDELTRLMNECNTRGGLRIQLVTDDSKAFDNRWARYGKFSGVKNYFALVGPKHPTLDERLGYYGEQLVLRAQQLGLNTCWVGLTFKKDKETVGVDTGERLRCVIALGYGTTQGTGHKVKPFHKVAHADGTPPQWFCQGVESALLAPTALNQQKFVFTLKGTRQVHAQAAWGFFSKLDLGIVKYHFEVGAGPENFEWV